MVPKFAQIAVDAPIRPGLTLTYSIPSGLDIVPGQVIWVPLASRQVTGIVFKNSDSTDILGVRPILGYLDPLPILTDQQLEMAEWLSSNVLCSLFEAASVMLPLEFRRKSRSFLKISSEYSSNEISLLSTTEREIITYLLKKGSIEEQRLLRTVDGKKELRGLLRRGIVIKEWKLQPPSVGPKQRGTLIFSGSKRDDYFQSNSSWKPSSKGIVLLESISRNGFLDTVSARKEFGYSVVAKLLSRGLIENRMHSEFRDPLLGKTFPVEKPQQLTDEQANALAFIKRSLEGTSCHKAFLLEGVTGSGKTEVYLQALAFCISQGKRGLFLVPEISLTPQLIHRLSSRFPGRIGLWHSGLTAGQQYDTWWRIRQGDFDIVLGSRSAVFTPIRDLGIIVIDEEHEWAYKQQEPAPRYHVRDVGQKLMVDTGCVLVLGSATPDVSSYYKGIIGEYTILRLRSRIGNRSVKGQGTGELANVQIVDMKEELKAGVRSIFSRPLHSALVDTLGRGEQAILFLNRRGTSWSIQCRDCGHVLVCSGCKAPVNYHGEQNRVICHHCGRRTNTPKLCPKCKGSQIRYLGLGTQRVVQEVEEKFRVKAIRWDRDTTQRPQDHAALMESFSRGDAQILVGTQMIAKGLDIPQVTLVGAMLADLGLFVPDFRAGERGFQLLSQVAGRAGRGGKPGLAIVQTYHPDHYAIQAAASQEFKRFYEIEIGFRQTYRNPPFSQLARLLYEHKNPVHARRAATGLVARMRSFLKDQGLTEIDVIGPAPGYPPQLRGKTRWHIVIRVPNGAPISIQNLLKEFQPSPEWTIDVNPMNIL